LDGASNSAMLFAVGGSVSISSLHPKKILQRSNIEKNGL
jgi:hypothetical protein